MNYSKLEITRKGKKITQSQLAAAVGISESTYKKNIAHQNMTIQVLESVAKVLEVPICTFFEETTTHYKLNDENSVVNENFNQNNQRSMENIIRELIQENGELKVENAKLHDQLAGNGNGDDINQTGT